MNIQFRGPTLSPGNETRVTALVGGTMYAITQNIDPLAERFREGIERQMFIDLMLMVYDKEIKT